MNDPKYYIKGALLGFVLAPLLVWLLIDNGPQPVVPKYHHTNTLPATFNYYVPAAERYWDVDITARARRGDPVICGADVAAYVIPDAPLDNVPDAQPWTVFVCSASWHLLTGEQQCWVAVHESGHKLGHTEHTRTGIMRPMIPNKVNLKVCQRYPPKERK
jgi:hypothetical protein